MMKYTCIVIIVCIVALSLSEEDDDEVGVQAVDGTEADVEPFIPTHEWKPVKPGQTVPAGLHIRMNLETGEKEAKLMDSQKSQSKDKTMSLQEVEEALKNIATSDGAEKSDSVDDGNKKFRSYEELKKDLGEADMKVRSDFQIIQELMDKFLAGASDEEKITILEDLEYYVHQWDNARYWVTLGGIHGMVLPSLNSTNQEIVAKVLYLLGSSMQNNPKVQISALEAGLVNQLLRIFKFNKDATVKSRALYAIGAITRRFPVAQKKLLIQGGLSIFKRVFSKNDADSLKLQIKIITLLQDLAMEHQDVEMEFNVSPNDETRQERLNQYRKVNFERKFELKGFCELLPKLLANPLVDKRDKRQDVGSAIDADVPIRPEHDVVEKVLNAMVTFLNTCKIKFVDSLGLINQMYKQYFELSTHEVKTDDKYYTNLAKLCEKIKSKVSTVRVEL